MRLSSLFLLFSLTLVFGQDDSPYLIGTGIWDITGPAAEGTYFEVTYTNLTVGMMGYAVPNQTTAGIHLRLRSRAVIIEDKLTSKRIAYVNLDLCFTTGLVKTHVLAQLDKLVPGYYSHENVLITATHTHSGPGGYSWCVK
eukprot:TRINITY_DN18012_c0_g1_i1.p1 TRINITY_DN18012_c0_g1~~TRINITY_DN18012_c0_g1_i1.p1  ORF type:complete len:141 (-),score=15.45 TRINITY_DN18012_c0_g1_i1:84-506(-)